MNSKSLSSRLARSGPVLMLLLLAALMVALLGEGCLPGRTFFSNDGPLGRRMSACHRLPERFTGCWEDLNSIGYRDLAAVPSLSYGLLCVLRPLWFSRLYMPVALVLLGMSAWFCFRRFGLSQPASVLGGLAATLNSAFFSAACWGSAAHAITVGMCFLAVAMLAASSSKQRWLRAVLGGLALGMAVIEGADIGAMFSVFVAAFVVWRGLVAEGPRVKNVVQGVLCVVVAALCAAVLAAEAISELVKTDVVGVVAAAERSSLSKEGHWDWATQWSLPKRETLGLIVPGLFGYKVDAQQGAAYWGTTGQDAAWERYLASDRRGPPPSGFLRFVGGGNYSGVLVVLLAGWAVAQSFRRKNSAFDPTQRRLLWFWLGAAVFSLLMAFGRYAPFYRWLYALPHLADFRNPVKFIHVFSFSLIVLFAFGVESLWKKHLRPPGLMPSYRWAGFWKWWKSVAGLERRWPQGCLLVLALSLVAWKLYDNARPDLEQYLHSVEFERDIPQAIADFSIRQVGWFVLFFSLASGLMTLILSGAFAGKRAVWGAVFLGVLLVADLGRADRPWVVVWDYAKKYASNPIVDRLRERPYEHRVADMPREFLEPEFQRAFGTSDPNARTDYLFYQVYSREWAQHLFCYYDIQSLDIVQLPRKPQDLSAFEKALTPGTNASDSRLTVRRWQLTNTRYVVGTMHFLDYFNHQLDPEQQRLHAVERFKLAARPGYGGAGLPLTTADVIAVPATNGPFALFEFTGALPRTRLYNRWQVITNDDEALRQIASASFDPTESVLVCGDLAAAAPADAGRDAGTVEFTSYAPRRIVLKANAATPSVLLLNDRFDPGWIVRVDGKPAKMLRCNYIMRGVYLTPGPHRVAFRFRPPIRMLYVSLTALAAGLLLICIVGVSGFRSWASLPPAAGPRPPNGRKQNNRKEGNNKDRLDAYSPASPGSVDKP
jgi:hypothetical protein